MKGRIEGKKGRKIAKRLTKDNIVRKVSTKIINVVYYCAI